MIKYFLRVILRIKAQFKPIMLALLLIGSFNIQGKSQPDYPADGFVIFFKTDFINFPKTLNNDNLRARHLDSVLTIVFIDSTKSIENDNLLVKKCTYNVLSVDTNNVAKLIVHIGSSYGLEKCYDDELIIKRDSSNLTTQNSDVLYWFSGKLIFIHKEKKKQFVCSNIPDGSWLDLQNIDFSKSTEYITIPPFHNSIVYEKENTTKFRSQ